MPPDDLPPGFTLRPLSPRMAAWLRRMCTEFGFPQSCGYPECARAGRCVTEKVMCYQASRDWLHPALQRMVLDSLGRSAAAGEIDALPPSLAQTIVNRDAHRAAHAEKRAARRRNRS